MLAFRPAAFEGLVILFVERFLPVFTEGVTFIAFPHENAAQVGVASELDAHQVPRFAFLQVRTGVNVNQ